MDLLRNLFGNLTSGIIRLAVTGGILVLCYLFIVKPVLDTTSEAIKSSGLRESPKKLIRCVESANGNTKKIQRCTRKF